MHADGVLYPSFPLIRASLKPAEAALQIDYPTLADTLKATTITSPLLKAPVRCVIPS
jgi:hypothetical protein